MGVNPFQAEEESNALCRWKLNPQNVLWGKRKRLSIPLVYSSTIYLKQQTYFFSKLDGCLVSTQWQHLLEQPCWELNTLPPDKAQAGDCDTLKKQTQTSECKERLSKAYGRVRLKSKILHVGIQNFSLYLSQGCQDCNSRLTCLNSWKFQL